MQRLANDVPHEQRVFASGLDNRKFDRALNDLKKFGEDATMKVEEKFTKFSSEPRDARKNHGI